MAKKFFDAYNGQEYFIYVLENENLCVEICDFGARINSIKYKGVNVILGFNSTAEYINSETYAGATIGRVANRIAKGEFSLSGAAYRLSCNEGQNHLHGGMCGFDKKLFKVIRYTDESITMRYESKDGEEGYPANLTTVVKFAIKNSTLKISFKATSDGETLWNPTNHTYFNLDGESSGDCRENMLSINADKYMPVDSELMPLGDTVSVKGTPFDFNCIKDVGSNFNSAELATTNGYDHNFILNSKHAARVESIKTGIAMDVYTDMPCLQLYTGGAIKPCRGKTRRYGQYAGFCLEPQFCPNAVNFDNFAKPIINSGETKRYYIKYEFSYGN